MRINYTEAVLQCCISSCKFKACFDGGRKLWVPRHSLSCAISLQPCPRKPGFVHDIYCCGARENDAISQATCRHCLALTSLSLAFPYKAVACTSHGRFVRDVSHLCSSADERSRRSCVQEVKTPAFGPRSHFGWLVYHGLLRFSALHTFLPRCGFIEVRLTFVIL